MVDVLHNMIDAVRSGGLVLDLQVFRPDPVVESGGRDICKVDGKPLFLTADAASAAVDDLVSRGSLAEQAVDDHVLRTHYATGADVIADFSGKGRTLSPEAIPRLRALDRPCTMRELSRLRRLVVTG